MSEVGRGYARPRPSKAVRGRGRGLNVNHDCGPMTKMLRPSFRPSYRRRWQNGSWLAAQHTITPTGAAACRRMTSLARASGLRFCAVCRRPSPLSLSLSLSRVSPSRSTAESAKWGHPHFERAAGVGGRVSLSTALDES